MTIRILFFAHLREELGTGEMEWEVVPGTSCGRLRDELGRAHPEIRLLLEETRVAVNQTLVPWEETLQGGEEVVFLSPVSGG